MTDLSPNPSLIGMGRYGLIYGLSSKVVVKVRRLPSPQTEGDANIKEEQACYRMLAKAFKKQTSCPYIIPMFHQAPDRAIFLLRAVTDLGCVITQENADGSPAYKHEPIRTNRWMGQLCGAITFLVEKLKIIHGDLRPDNVLVDSNNNLRVSDFAAWEPVGKTFISMASEPWGRFQGQVDGVPDNVWSYGEAGARTESFALGSFYYSLLRGYYPYAKDKVSKYERMLKFRRKEFPPLDIRQPEDAIISRCWNGYYKYDTVSLSELEQVFRDLGDGTEWYRFELEDTEEFVTLQQACEVWAAAGHLDTVVAQRTN